MSKINFYFKPLKALLVILTVLFCFQGYADDSLFYLCKGGGEVRSLRVATKDGKCTAFYSKSGIEQAIGATSSNSGETCEPYVEGIRRTLESVNWKCKRAKLSSTTEVLIN